MDPISLASAAVTVLKPLLGQFTDGALSRAGATAADSTGNAITTLYHAIKKRMTGDAYNQAIMQGAEDKPDSPERLDTLAKTLASILQEDPEFTATLASLLDQATAGQHIQATDSGATAGRDFHQTGTYVAGRDLIIGE